MMKKIKVFTIPVLVLTLLAASLLCCCMERAAVASQLSGASKMSDHCKHKAAQAQKSAKQDDCQCQQTLSIAERAADTFTHLAQVSFTKFPIASLIIVRDNSVDQQVNNFFSISPQKSHAIPLYLTFRTLRL